MTDPEPAGAGDPHDRRHLPSLLAGYWAFGQFWGVWVIAISAYNERHGVDDAGYGLYLASLSVAAVIVMAVVAPRMSRLPLAFTVPGALAVLAVGAIVMAVVGSSTLWVAFAVVGAGNGLIDVFLNVDAQRLEAATGRPVLQWLHAMYALGGVTGAAIAGVVAAAGLDERTALFAAAATLLATAAWNAVRADPRSTPEVERRRLSLSAFRRHPGLLAAGMVVLFAFLVEGSMDTWAGRYVQETLGADATTAAWVFIAFSLALFFGRLFAGKVLFSMGRRTTILIAGVAAAAAGATAALTGSIAVVGAAYILMGFAISAVAPAGFGLVEEVAPRDQANAITAVTTLGYGGFVISPPIFGAVAQAYGLRAAMAVIVSSTAGIVIAGLRAPRDRVPAEV